MNITAMTALAFVACLCIGVLSARRREARQWPLASVAIAAVVGLVVVAVAS